jgi:hypothetical protein
MSISNFFQSSPSSYSEDVGNNDTDLGDMTLNIIGELNREDTHDTHDVSSEYAIRTRLYENKEAFFESDNTNSTENTDQEIIDISNTVKKGQLMLKKEIIRYSTLKDSLDDINKIQFNFHDQVMLMKKSLLILGELKLDLNNDILDYKEDLDNIHNALDTFDKKVCSHITNQSSNLRTEYSNSFQKLLQLKDVYKILKNSDITFACPICLTRQVESFLAPCGHTYCASCIDDIKQRCYICRQNFTKICSLYFN